MLFGVQDEPLELRVIEQDPYSSEVAGTAYVDLAPLLMRGAIAHALAPMSSGELGVTTDGTLDSIGVDADDAAVQSLSSTEEAAGHRSIRGWQPLFDTFKGMCGSLYVTIKVQSLSGGVAGDAHKGEAQDAQASTCVQFFFASKLSSKSFVIREVFGLVTDLVLEIDSDASWQDYFRRAGQGSKALTDNRQKVLFELAACVRQGLARKTLEMGGNAVLGYRVSVDLEGASGIVVRGTGTACSILAVVPMTHNSSAGAAERAEREKDRGPSVPSETGAHHDRHADIAQAASGATTALISASGGWLDADMDPAALIVHGADALTFMSEYFHFCVASAGGAGSQRYSPLSLPMDALDADDELNGPTMLVMLPRGLAGIAAAAAGVASGGGISSGYGLGLASNPNPGANGGATNELLMLQVGASLLRPFGPRLPEILRSDRYKTRSRSGMLGMELPDGAAGRDRDTIGMGHGRSEETQGIWDDVTLMSLTTLPGFMSAKLGGLVSVRSVKYMGKGKLEATQAPPTQEEQQQTRAGWWTELREEIKSHARTMCCTHIIGYQETCSIIADVCVLSAQGTAAVIKNTTFPVASAKEMLTELALMSAAPAMGHSGRSAAMMTEESRDKGRGREFLGSGPITLSVSGSPPSTPMAQMTINQLSNPGSASNSSKPTPREKLSRQSSFYSTHGGSGTQAVMPNPTQAVKKLAAMARPYGKQVRCQAVHVPYNRQHAPFAFMRLLPCAVCRRKWVPEMLLSTCMLPSGLDIKGQPVLVEARVARSRVRAVAGGGEADAGKISEALPFTEFDVQRQLMFKLRVSGLNAAFGYKSIMQISSNGIVAVASCTAVFLNALPSPPMLLLRQPQAGHTLQSRAAVWGGVSWVQMRTHLEELMS